MLNRIKKLRLKKISNMQKILLVILGIVFLASVFYLCTIYRGSLQHAMAQPRSVFTVQNRASSGIVDSPSVRLQEGEKLLQEVTMVSSGIDGISIYLSQEQEAETQWNVSFINNSSNKSEAQWTMSTGNLPEGFISFYFPQRLNVVQGDKYTIAIEIMGDQGGVSLETAELGSTVSPMVFDGEEQQKAISFQLLKGNNEALIWSFAGLCIAIFLLFLILAAVVIFEIKIELVSSIFILLVGSIYIIILPPFTVPDEGSHFVTAYEKSSKLLGVKSVNEEGETILYKEHGSYLVRDEIPTIHSYSKYTEGALGISDNVLKESQLTRKPLSARHLGYMPQVAGIALARLLRANGEQLLLLGRVFALLWYALVMYFSVRLIPFGKIPLVLIGLFPMTMQQAISYSYDSVLNGLGFLIVAYILALAYQKEKVEVKDIVIIIILSAVMVPIKFIYAPILGLGLLIPSSKFGGIKKKIYTSVLLVLVSVGAIVITRLTMIASVMGLGSAAAGDDVVMYSMSYVLGHPLEIVTIFIRTVLEKGSFYIESMVGASLGWMELNISNVFVSGIFILVLASLIDGKDNCRSPKRNDRIIMLMLSGLVIILVMAGLLLDYTFVGSDIILGVQGRYFLPILPLILLSCKNNKIFWRAYPEKILVSGMVITQVGIIIQIFSTTVSGLGWQR